MPIYFPDSGCVICGKPVGNNPNEIIGFDFIEVPQPEFRRFGDTVAHVSCLSAWERRDEFIAVWNQALSEHFAGKALVVDTNGRVDYTDPRTWRVQPSPAVQRRQEEQRAIHEADAARRRDDFQHRLDAARQKAIGLGLADAANVDRVLRGLPAADFHRHFGELKISRAFFHEET